jgi:ADP-heptose:LPS heptosyltransferase
MLTAAVRDLHCAHPGAFITAVDTSAPALWDNNPHIVRHGTLREPARIVECAYPLIHESNRRPYHFIHGFTQDLERQLGVRIPAGPFKGEVFLSRAESEAPSPVARQGHSGPYWVIVAGGKLDLTAKWWDPAFAQSVVNHFAGAVRFVQCGASGDWHPRLRGVIDMVGRTTLREMIRVLYHADGVVCPVTFAMHLAAAVPPKPGGPPLKPCVVVAGGREPAHWEMYPGHQFLHTVGALTCCASGGCWKSRCLPVGDGGGGDVDLCTSPVTLDSGLQVGRCMTMIRPEKVVDAIETYYEGGVLTRRPAAASPVPVAGKSAGVALPAVPAARQGMAVTIGVGGYAEMARLAAREVTALTGLPSVVLGDEVYRQASLCHPDYLKYRLFDLVDSENIFFFDADMVCLERWDPRAYFGAAGLTAVRDRLIGQIGREAAEWGVPAEDYFNAGMFIINRAHHLGMLREAERICFSRDTAYFAQTPLNAARARLGIPVNLLERRYNWVGFGSSLLSHEVPVVMAHKLVPDQLESNVAYFLGDHPLYEPTLRLNRATRERLASKRFTLVEDGSSRDIQLRGDGTVLPPAAPHDEGYWFVHDRSGRPTLALASEERIEREFIEAFGGTWIEVEALRRCDAGARLVERGAPEPLVPTAETARRLADEFLADMAPYPVGRYSGRGIVICGGGRRYFPSAWVCLRMLRHVGCRLPVELWQLTGSELDERQRALVERLGVRCVDADEVRLRHPPRMLGGWELKSYALAYSAFEEVLLLDADNVSLRDPTYLFDSAGYRDAGAVFWPDYGRLPPDHPIWQICGVEYRDEPEFESGQVLVNKRRCWRPLQLTTHLNDYSDFYYQYVHGDKETFHMAWRITGQDYRMVDVPVATLEGLTMCQHDFEGHRLFQHRHGAKWSLEGQNRRIKGFEAEDLCLGFLAELRDSIEQ